MREKLKPCPVCGKDKIGIAYVDQGTHMVQCVCGLTTRYIISDDLSYVESVWNNRPIEDALQREISELTAEVEPMRIVVDRLPEYNTLQAQLTAAQKLCEIYFNIAAEAIGEDVVRAKRDAALKGDK